MVLCLSCYKILSSLSSLLESSNGGDVGLTNGRSMEGRGFKFFLLLALIISLQMRDEQMDNLQ